MYNQTGSRPPFKGRDPPIIRTIYGVNVGSDFREGDNVTLSYSLPVYAVEIRHPNYPPLLMSAE
jgi:hypothetical protein